MKENTRISLGRLYSSSDSSRNTISFRNMISVAINTFTVLLSFILKSHLGKKIMRTLFMLSLWHYLGINLSWQYFICQNSFLRYFIISLRGCSGNTAQT